MSKSYSHTSGGHKNINRTAATFTAQTLQPHVRNAQEADGVNAVSNRVPTRRTLQTVPTDLEDNGAVKAMRYTSVYENATHHSQDTNSL